MFTLNKIYHIVAKWEPAFVKNVICDIPISKLHVALE